MMLSANSSEVIIFRVGEGHRFDSTALTEGVIPSQPVLSSGDDAGSRLRVRLVGVVGREGLARRRQAVVVGDGVVDDAHVDRVLQRDAAAGQGRHVVDDHVVEDVHRIPRIVPPLVAVSSWGRCPDWRSTSWPLMPARRMPPPSPAPAELPWIRLPITWTLPEPG